MKILGSEADLIAQSSVSFGTKYALSSWEDGEHCPDRGHTHKSRENNEWKIWNNKGAKDKMVIEHNKSHEKEGEIKWSGVSIGFCSIKWTKGIGQKDL